MALNLLGLFVASLVLIVGSGCAYKLHLTHTLASQEKEMIETALAECKGRVSGPSGAASKFDISPPRWNQRPERSRSTSAALFSPHLHQPSQLAREFSRTRENPRLQLRHARPFSTTSDWHSPCVPHQQHDGLQTEPMTLKIQRSAEDGLVVFTLTGRIQVEHLPELQKLLAMEATDQNVVLDLDQVRLVDRETVKFLKQCEADGAKLENCPAYIREWMEKERNRT
jgi:hypothetical protein